MSADASNFVKWSKNNTSADTVKSTKQTLGATASTLKRGSSGNWYSGSKPTLGEIYAQIQRIGATDPESGKKAVKYLTQLQNDKSSQFYRPYAQATNRAADYLAANGFNTELLTNGWLNSSEAAGYIRSNLVYDGATNTPKTPGKRATADQVNAYWLNQYMSAEKDTNAALNEIKGSQDYINYWTNAADRNLSDDQIKQKYKDEYYSKNCPTLQKMQSSADANKPMELNQAMDFSDDTIDAMIWMARNPGYNGSIEGAMAYSYLGEGNQWKDDAEISAMLDPKSEQFLPYAVGSTNLDDEAYLFNVRSFTKDWIAENNGLQYEDSERGKAFRKVLATESDTESAENAREGLYKWIDQNKNKWDTQEEAQEALDKVLAKGTLTIGKGKDKTVYDLSILNKIDTTIGKNGEMGTGNLIAFNRPIDYKYDNVVRELGDIVTANASRKTDMETTNEMADDLSIASTEPAAMPEPQKPAATDEIDAVSGADQIVKKPESKPEMKPPVPAGNESTIPKYTDAEIEQIKTQDKKIREAAGTVENVATANESTIMKNAGSVAFFANKQRFDKIRTDSVGNQRFADGLVNISSKNLINDGLDKAYSVAEYSNVEANYAADQRRFDELKQKYGDLEYLQKEFKPTMTLTLEGADGDTYNVTLTYQDMNKGYQISDVVNTNYVFGESESGNDPGIYEQANAIAREQTAEAKKILFAQKNIHDNYGESGEEEVEEYKSLSARIHNEEEYLAENKDANEQNTAELTKSIKQMEMQYDAMMKQGLDASSVQNAYRLLNDILQYHDEPQLPRSTMTKLQYVDMLGELTGEEYDTAKKSELLHSSIENIDAKIRQIQDDIAYAKANGIEIPDSYLRNMQLTIEDLEADRKGCEYSAILTDTDPEELDKAIEAGKEFEQYVIDNVLIDDNIIHPAYGFEHLQQVATEEDQKIYYYLLGKQALEHGDEYQALLHSNNPDDVLTKSGELMESIMKDSSDYMDFMYNDDYGVWTSRRAEANKAEAKAMVDSGFGGGLIANVASTLLTPIESLSSAIYILDRAIEGKRINPDSKFRNVTQFKESTRAETRASIEKTYENKPALKYLANLGYEIYCNRGDSMMNSLLTGAVINGTGMLAEFAGASPMGATAALTAAANAIENGASTEQAWLIAGMTFIAETATEAVTYSNIREAFGVGEELTKESLKQFTIDWLQKNGIEEMIGETTNDMVENWADRMAAEWFDNPNYQSEHQKLVDAYYAQGYTGEGEAEAKALEEEMKGYLHTAFVSYISAGTDVMTKVGKAAYNTARSAADVVNGYRSYTKARQQMGFGESMLDYMKQDARNAIASRNQNTQTSQEASEQEAGTAVPSEAEEATPEQKQAAADVTALGRVEGSTVTAQTEMIASILDNGDGNETVTEQASAAAAFLGDMLGDDTSYIVQQVMTGVSRANISRDVITTALQNAALGNGAATAVVQSEQFQNASPEQKAQMLAETVEQDQSNPDVQQNIAAKVNDFRSGMVINDLAAQGHFDQAQQAQDQADKAAIETAKAESQLQEKQDALDAATADVEQKAQAVAENPTDDNMKQHADAVTRADNADESRKQYEEHLAKQQEAQKEADAKAQKATEDAMTSARETASQTVAQQDQQRQVEAEAIAEQQRQFAAEQAEAERQQKIADQRSGKTAEESARVKIQRLAEARGYTGEQAEQFVNDVMNFWQTGQVNKIDMSKQFSKSEGYLMMGALARRFGVNVEIGEIATGENGYYDPATNTIRLNSNLPAGQILVEFAEHEFTHTLEQMKAYKQYHDAALNILYQSDAELNDAVAKKMAEYEDNGHPINEDQAKKELVAEFTRLKLNDKAVVQRMVDSGMGGRIRNALHNINQFLKNIRLTGEARTEAENLRRTERLFQKAIRDRSRAQAKARTEAIKQANTPAAKLERSATPVVSNAQGDAEVSEVRGGTISRTDGDTEYSVASWTDEEKQRVRNQLKDRMMSENDGSMTEEEMDEKIDKWVDDVNSVASIILSDQHRLDYDVTDPNKRFLKDNQDYIYTLDASTLCAKRLLFQGTFDTIQRMLPNTPLLPEDLIDLANMMRDMGYETPCGICYVESRRRWLGKYANEWLSSYDGEYIPTIQQLTTSDGLEELRKSHPEAYESFTAAMRSKGSANPKVVQLRTDYRGDIDTMTPGEVQKVIDIGGLRIQSFSDFEVPHLIDMMQAVLDMASHGLTSQAYTKVPAFAAVFGDTGIKINLSEIGKDTGISIDNGLTFDDISSMPYEEAKELIHLLYDDIEGMPHDQAMALRNQYSKNVGTILVGMNDAHIIAAMADGEVDFIIPFHKSGWSQDELNKMPVLNSYDDYTNTQNERIIIGKKTKKETGKGQKAVDNWIAKNGDKYKDYKVTEEGNGKYTITYTDGYETESFQKHKERTGEKLGNFEPVGANQYWDFSKSGQENAEAYLEMCKKEGRVPKFSQFLVDNGDGSFSLPQGDDFRSTAIREGYWKTLIDFKMYDNEGNGSEQTVVTPNVNMDAAQDVLNNYSLSRQMPNGQTVTREDNNTLPVAQEVVDAYVQKYKDEHPGREYSARTAELTDAQKAQALQEANVDYEEAVARGDMKAAQENVDFYAEQNGFDTQEKAYHGTDSFGFTEFDMEQSQDMIFVAYSKDMAGTYVSYEDPSVKKVSEAVKLNKPVKEMNGQELFEAAKKYLKTIEGSEVLSIDYDPKSDMYTVTTDESNYFDPNATVTQEFIEYDIKHYLQSSIDELSAGIYQFYTRPGKQLVIDADTTSWDDIPVQFSDETMSTREIAEWARNNGYDSVRINGIWDYGGNGPDLDGYGDIGIFFNQNDVKSADPVTYDDNGNVISLDQRFSDSNDIRYSVENNQMTDAERNQALIDAGLMTQEELMAQENLPGYPAEGGEAQRQFGYETAQESNALHDEVKQYLYTHSNYMPDTNQGQVNRAIGWVQSKATESDPDGYYAALDEIASDTFDYRSADGQARMLTVMSMAALKAENGRTAEERRNALNDELRIADAYNKQGTDLGRALQARKIFRLMTPLGRVAALQSMADRINEDYGKKGIKNRVGLSEWTLKAASEAQTEEDFQKVQDAAAKELAEQMPVSWKERLNALRMLSMLGNPRTHIRNIIGNALFVPAVSLKNKLGAVMELGMDKGDRTKTLALAVSKEIRDFERQEAETMKDTLTGTAKYNEDSKVQMERKIFGTGDGILSKTVGNFIQTLSDFNSNALEGEDWFFLKGHYRRALGGWIQANGYTVDEVQSNPDLLEKGRQYAIEEAQKATYRDFNEMAKRLNDATRDAKTVWGKSLAFGVNAVLPFKKTPANILRRGLEYSPLGIAKSLTADAFHLHQYNEYQKGNLEVLPETAISPNQFIDKLCSGLTGSAIMAVGFLLAGCGAVTCGLDDDDDEFEKLKGGQEYSVNFGKLGNMVTEGLFKAKLFGEDVTFTMDWAAPMSMPFFVGAALREQMDGEGVTDIDGVLNAIFSIGEPLTNLSMLDGLNSVFRTSQNSDAITQVGAKIVSNYLTSFIPSAVGAVARSFDPIRRKSFIESGKGSGPAGIFRSSIEQSKNKIPGMSMNSIPVRDAFGNVEETGAVERILENFALPGYLNSYKNDPVIDELERLYGMVDESKKSGMVPKMPQKTIGNGKVVLSAEQYDQLTEERGKTAHALIEQLMANRYYQQVSDDDKATMINDVWTYATQNANYSISKDAKVDTWVLNSRANPIQGIVNRQKARVDTEYKEGYKAAAVESVRNQNWDDLDVCIEKLEEAGVKDPEGSIKTAVGNAFKAQYIRAYQEGDSITMDEIETLLIDSGLGFDSVNKKGQSTFDIWIENMNDQVLSEEEEE